MSRDLYTCTAAELATHSVERLQHDTAASKAATWLDENGYDAAPSYDDDGQSASSTQTTSQQTTRKRPSTSNTHQPSRGRSG
jgi:hypothetical protein